MITFKKLLEKAKSENIAVHTPTQKQAITLLKALDERGYRWINNERLTTKTLYEYENESTCYNFEHNNKIMYSPLDYYQQEYYAIVEFSDIDFKVEI